MKFRKLKAEEIEVRVGNVNKSGYSLLLYKDARVDMEILDETVGANNWQRKHYELKGNMFCSVGIFTKENQWVWKDDCGTAGDYEKEKAEASDSFKRACVNWGIGRELYTAPKIFIFCETEADGKFWKLPKEELYRSLQVVEIEYEGENIKNIVIGDRKTGEILYSNKVATKNEKEKVIGGAKVLTGGKYDGKTISEVFKIDQSYCEFCAKNSKSEVMRKNFQKVLDENFTPTEVEV